MAEIEWLVARIRNKTSLKVETVSGWKDRGRPASTGTFNPRGVLVHHTAFPASKSNPHPGLNTVINGRSDLPGPLCHVLLDFNGVCHIVASGRANHAGVAQASGPMPAGDGNSLYIGIEIDYDPRVQAASAAQRNAIPVLAAVLVTRLGNGRNFVRAHKETSVTGKVDPQRLTSMSNLRDLVGTNIKLHPDWKS